ncbi:MAG TPA: serine/threonine-protein kinase [Patescibacteria group bacterium]|nr:serine/threonine-protein kinase [Patescibacteria group bacterium]
MNPESPDRGRALREFERVAELEGEAQAAALADLAQESTWLAGEVRALLAADAESGVLDRDGPMADVVAASEAHAALDRSGQTVGAYRLLERVGRGGMGDVYRAERSNAEFRQTVAIKLLRRGLDSADLLARFAQERRILARLDHPGIARLVDGGSDQDGTPYLAMEFVAGEPLTDYARRMKSPLAARLRMVMAMCEAVDAAHRQLVVHRDLKPSNVLVQFDGSVKLLDFGIAKLLGGDDGDALRTEAGMRVLTPAYAAPEQHRGEAVGTAVDVYALGVILHELLTGELPIHSGGTDPASSSRQALAPSEALRKASATHTQTTARDLAGDLDTIVLKALHPEPQRRYPSALALADDLQRFLDGRPISARPDTLGYRVGKFVQRHRGGVALGVLSLAGIVVALGVALWQAREAREQAQRADNEARRAESEAAVARDMSARNKRVKEFWITVFLQEDPLRRDARGPLTMAEAFEDTLQRIDTELADDPALQGDLLDDFGEIVTAKGDFARAQSLFERALANAEKAHGPNDPAVAESLVNLGVLAGYRGHRTESKPHLERAVAILEKQVPQEPLALANAYSALAALLRDAGELPKAAELMRRALTMFDGVDPDLPARIAALHNLATVLLDSGRHDEAEPLIREAIAATERTQGVDAAPLVILMEGLEQVLSARGALDQEHALGARRLAIARKNFAQDHAWTASALAEHGWQKSRMGNWQEGEAMIRDAIAMRRRLNPAGANTVEPLHRLGQSQLRRGDAVAAFASLDEGHATCAVNGIANGKVCLTMRANRAAAMALVGRGEEALRESEQVIALMRERYPTAPDELAQAQEAQARAYAALGRYEEAAASQREALAAFTAIYGAQRSAGVKARLDAYAAAAARTD